MSNSYNNTTEQNIKFNETPIVSHTDFNMSSHHTTPLGRYTINKNCEYLRFRCGVTVSDTTLSSNGFGAVCVNYEIHYKDSEGNNQVILDGFYPKYKHENNNKSDQTIVNAPGLIDYVEIELINNEDIQVNISDFLVFYAEPIDGDTIVDLLNDYTDNGGTFNLVIPLVETLPDPADVPDGYICRLASL